jgi:glycosyltransferase involved in cell wall biosynthesis
VRVALIGPVYPFRAGIAYCTTRLSEELAARFDLRLISFKRQYPRLFYPGGYDIDPTLKDRVPPSARFLLDVLNPLSWIRVGRLLRAERVEVVVLVWWVWIWAIPYRVVCALSRASVVVQCHNVTDKEPGWWKTALTNLVLRRAQQVIVHAASDADEVRQRIGNGPSIHRMFLPVHELGGEIPSREAARQRLRLGAGPIALFFGYVRPFKGLDVVLRAWSLLRSGVRLVIAGEVWWDEEPRYRQLIEDLDLGDKVVFHPRFIPDAEVANYFAAADVVLVPYRREAQSGVVMTALHFARPVIATGVGGIPEVVRDGENGLLIAPDDPAALAAAVNTFFQGDREAMERAAARSAGEFSWLRYGRELIALLERTAK